MEPNYIIIAAIGAVLALIATCIICKIDFFKSKNGQKIKGKKLVILGCWLFFPFVYGEMAIGIAGLVIFGIGMLRVLSSQEKIEKAEESAYQQNATYAPPAMYTPPVMPQTPAPAPASAPAPAPASAPAPAPAPTVNADSVAKMKEYKELLDMGAITQEEFEIKKRELLGF